MDINTLKFCIETLSIKGCIELIAALSIPLSVFLILRNREKLGKGIGVRCVQFLGITVMTPTILIAACEGFLDGNSIATLLGAFVGYLFSNISEFKNGHQSQDTE